MLLHGTISQNTTRLLNESDFFDQRTYMGFFYIGTDGSMFEHFINHFQFGYKEANLYDAGKLLNQLYLRNNKLPDVLFIDVPFDEAELHKFCGKLKLNLLLKTLPVIYNDNQLSDKQINKLKQLQLIDDVVAVDDGRIDYCSKVMFLKQSKLYNQLYTPFKNEKLKNKTFNIPLFFKRVTDVIVASTCIILLSPVLLVIAVIIKFESKGPIFYTSLRAGKGFKVFKFYKFRSMKAGADKEIDTLSHFNQYGKNDSGPKFFKINNDPRVTKFGKLLRNTSADELPQLLNVLKGDMSLVGNRPLPIYEAVTLTTDEFVERFTAPAGITGLWQVNKRGKADMSTEERINLDITYSRNFNFMYDLKIIAKTPLAVFQKSDV